MSSILLGSSIFDVLSISTDISSVAVSQDQSFLFPIDDSVSVQFYKSIDVIVDRWQTVVPKNNTFFGRAFLKALELAPPSDAQYRYALFSTEEQGDIGIGYYQIKTIRLDESIRFDKDISGSKASRMLARVKKSVASRFRAHTLVVGNLTLTGNYGMFFRDYITVEKKFSLVEQSLEILKPQLRKEGIKVRGVIYKDFLDNHLMSEESGYTKFSVQPTMKVDIRSEWKTIEDYVSAMKSKYRVRMRSARKKARDIQKRVLSVSEIDSYKDEIFRLYRYVSDQAGFNLFILKYNYFYHLKDQLGDKLRVTGYFLEDKMVGFYTSILSQDALDAHFLGYDHNYNGSHQLYLNMLYDLVEEGIKQSVSHVDMSRTALEIKSSVGATQTNLNLYIKLSSKAIDRYTPKLLDFLTPKKEWKARNPFR